MDELEKLKAEAEGLRAELAAEKEKAAAFRKEADGLRNAEKKTEAAAFFGKLRDAGKLTPALYDKAVTLDAELDGERRKEYGAA
jgi:hypothetical protein